LRIGKRDSGTVNQGGDGFRAILSAVLSRRTIVSVVGHQAGLIRDALKKFAVRHAAGERGQASKRRKAKERTIGRAFRRAIDGAARLAASLAARRRPSATIGLDMTMNGLGLALMSRALGTEFGPPRPDQSGISNVARLIFPDDAAVIVQDRRCGARNLDFIDIRLTH
jgi:hypothetical protein